MINRRMVCVGGAASALAAPWDLAAAMPIGKPADAVESTWRYAQLVPPIRPPKSEDLAEPKAFGQYLMQNAYVRISEAGISIEEDAKAEIQKVADQSAAAAFVPQKKEVRVLKGATYDALPIEVRRLIVLRNFNTFVDVLIVVALNESKKLSKDVINRVQGFLCPLYPICTG